MTIGFFHGIVLWYLKELWWMIVWGSTFAEAQDTLRKKLLTSHAYGDHQASSTTSGALVCCCCRTGYSWWNAPLTKLQCRRVAQGWLKEALTPSGRVGINLSPFMILFASFFQENVCSWLIDYEKVLHWKVHKKNQHENKSDSLPYEHESQWKSSFRLSRLHILLRFEGTCCSKSSSLVCFTISSW